MGAPVAEGHDLSVVIDSRRRVVASDAPWLARGEQLVEGSWLGGPLLLAIDAAARGAPERRVARDASRGTHWLLDATITGEDPRWASVRLVDATMAVRSDRDAMDAKLVHWAQNISFALLSVLDAIDACRPSGAELDGYLAHLRRPAGALTDTMTRLGVALGPLDLHVAPTSAAAIVERAALRVPEKHRPARRVVPEGWTLSADVDLLSEALAATLLVSAATPPLALEVDRADVDGRARTRFLVTMKATGMDPRALADLWSSSGPLGYAATVTLGRARAIALAHDGDVFSESADEGLVRLGLRVPFGALDP